LENYSLAGFAVYENLDAFPEIRETELMDLNMLKPEPIASPDWAGDGEKRCDIFVT
jgi:hypothetical protein